MLSAPNCARYLYPCVCMRACVWVQNVTFQARLAAIYCYHQTNKFRLPNVCHGTAVLALTVSNRTLFLTCCLLSLTHSLSHTVCATLYYNAIAERSTEREGTIEQTNKRTLYNRSQPNAITAVFVVCMMDIMFE